MVAPHCNSRGKQHVKVMWGDYIEKVEKINLIQFGRLRELNQYSFVLKFEKQ